MNVSRFEVERSADGVAFTKVGEVSVNNTTSGLYSFTDINARAFFNKGYYRLKLIDIDSKAGYSKIILANFGSSLATDIRPTQLKAGSPLYILTAAAENRSSYSGFLYNQSGQLIQSWKAAIGSNKQIETSKLTPGVYVVKLVTSKEIKTQKITVN